MSQKDFVYMSIYRMALKLGAIERIAKEQAQMGLDDYKKNRFTGKVGELISKRAKNAKKLS